MCFQTEYENIPKNFRSFTIIKLTTFQRCKNDQHTQINNKHHIQKLRDGNPMIVSIDAEKGFVKKKSLHGKSSENTRKLSVSVTFPLPVIKYPDKSN